MTVTVTVTVFDSVHVRVRLDPFFWVGEIEWNDILRWLVLNVGMVSGV